MSSTLLGLDLTRLFVEHLDRTNSGGSLLFLSVGVVPASVVVIGFPDDLGEVVADVRGALNEVVGVVVPDYQETFGCYDSGVLVLTSSGEVFHAGEDLDVESVGQWDVSVLVVPHEESLDHSGVDSHCALLKGQYVLYMVQRG